jgi:tetratricopeptide (TPR) repeat protein
MGSIVGGAVGLRRSVPRAAPGLPVRCPDAPRAPAVGRSADKERVSRDYSSKLLLERAERARIKGRTRRAIARYRELLAVDREAPEVHAKLAPLLARTRQRFDAWQSFRAAAEGFMRAQDPERALAIYYDAAHHLPRLTEIWQMIARLQCARGKSQEALRVLREGRTKFRRRGQRAEAIHLLRAAQDVDPWHTDVVLDLAKLLWLNRQRAESLLLLEGLAQRSVGVPLRRARALQFRISLRPAHAWLWLKALRTSRWHPSPQRVAT